MVDRVYILFGILNNKIDYWAVYKTREIAEKHKESLIKGDTDLGLEGWKYHIQEEIIRPY